MISKQQALEFIYELSQKTEVMLDITCGEVQFNRVSSDEYLYTTFSELPTFESAITKCIKENMEVIESMGIEKIPVDIDMLEVGQTYRVIYSNYWDELEEFTSKLIDIDYDRHTNYKLFEFSNDSIINQGHVEEVYKVNEYANM